MADFRVRRGSIEDLQDELLAFEGRYGVPSARLEDAFDGDGDETDDEYRWATVYGILDRIGRLPVHA